MSTRPTTGRIREERFAIVVYATSRAAYEGERRPGQHLADATQAATLGQRASFHVDVSRVACPPLNSDYFPEMHERVIPTYGSDGSFVEAVIKRQRELIETGFRIALIDLMSRSHSKP